MSLIGGAAFLERLQFFNGQRLFASDLQSLEEFNREMRWLHNQSLHQPGVGSGFAVAGKKGDREITIQPGYAIDALGREIVLTENRVEPVPPVANDGFGNPVFYDLVVSYPDESDLKETETREGICLPRGVVRLREIPVFCWVKLGPLPDRLPVNGTLRDEVQNGLRIRLARAEVLNCQLESPVSKAQRKNARPLAQPYVACGKSDTKNWTVVPPSGTAGFGIEIKRTVDTSSGRFRTTPCYAAHVVGERHFSLQLVASQVDLMLDGFLNISNPKPDGFDLSVLVPETFVKQVAAGVLVPALPDKLEKDNKWFVEWMGVEG